MPSVKTGGSAEGKLFIGVAAPEQVAASIFEYRQWMAAHYGCRSGIRTPPHVTLIPPFLPERVELVEDVWALLAAFARGREGFTARIENFDAFDGRTLFAALRTDERWGVLHQALDRKLGTALPGLFKAGKHRFHPHLTIANRDIPEGAMEMALEHLRLTPFEADFPVDHAALFAFEHGVWLEKCRWLFARPPREAEFRVIRSGIHEESEERSR